jgi:hypothetical protein
MRRSRLANWDNGKVPLPVNGDHSLGIFLGGAADGFLGFTDAFLDFAFDLLAGVAGDGSGDVVGFALDLLDLSCGNVFASHDDLLYKKSLMGLQTRCRR